MSDEKARVSSSVAATSQPEWNSLDDRSATRKDVDVSAGLPKAKKPYGKPTYRYERVFETLALSCGKIGATQGLCQVQQKSS